MAETDRLNIKLPTGYGKTFTACACYAVKQRQGINRVLFVFPTISQLEQFKQDGANDLLDACVEGSRKIIDVGHLGVNAIKFHRKNEAHVFAVTVQSLSMSATQAVVRDLFSSGNWMVIVDEYHHYGAEKVWGKTILSLNFKSLLAMSATPNRPGDDSAFGPPDYGIPYREAVDQGALKPLRGHSYNYVVDAVVEGGELLQFSTDDLIREAGGDAPEAIEKLRVSRSMRWSPKYISPLVYHPLDRMISERVRTGHKLQAIVGAMCCSHARMVCEQIRAMYDELVVDWVGTGPEGRRSDENAGILAKFCPPKDEFGNRNPGIDVLVHVGMAGEGLDSIHVTEVIHLNKASINNSNLQENGRAARMLRDPSGKPITGNINFDSSSEFAAKRYVGSAIMDAMDDAEPSEQVDAEESESKSSESEISRLPDEPQTHILDMWLENIDSGDPGVRLMARLMEKNGTPMNFEAMYDDPEHEDWDKAIKAYKIMRMKEAEHFNESSRVMQIQDAVNKALSVVASLVIRLTSTPGSRREKSIAGDIKKRINSRKKLECGKVTEDVETLNRHYSWLKRLETELVEGGVPQWLL